MGYRITKLVIAFVLASSAFLLTACRIDPEGIGRWTEELVQHKLGEFQKGWDESYARDTTPDKWTLVIDHGCENIYDFRDMFGQDLLKSLKANDSLDSNWLKLHDYWSTHIRNYELISTEHYPHGVLAAEYTVRAYESTHRLDRPDGKFEVYHLYFVVHTPKEEDPSKRGVWSISLVDDTTYHEKGFTFAAKPSEEEREQGVSPCGVFVGDETRTLASAIETPARIKDFDPNVIGPGFNRDGQVTVMDDAGDKPQKYSEELAAKLEACFDERDAVSLESLFSDTVLDVHPNTAEDIKDVIRFLSKSDGQVRITDVDEHMARGATTMSYLHDEEWDNHVQSGFATYYVGFEAVVTCDGKKYQLRVDCCTDYERNAGRLGIIGMALYPETPGAEFPYGREPVAAAGTNMTLINLDG